jgi:hypothetical protein
MDHTYIEEHQIADRYVQGTLPADEAERFENHYLSCPACLDSLDLAESVQRGFRRAATQDAERLAATRQLALVAWLARLSRRGQAGVLVSALLVLAVLPALLAFRGIARHDQELAQERQRSAASARSAGEAASLHAQLQATRQALAAASTARAQAVQRLSLLEQPQGGFPILPLDQERGAGGSRTEPTQRFQQPRAGMVVLNPALDPPFQPSYSARLHDRQGHEISSWTGLQPVRDGLTLSLPASRMPPGDYALVVDGITTGARPVRTGTFAFRVLPAQK